jgi:hypothetical protein
MSLPPTSQDVLVQPPGTLVRRVQRGRLRMEVLLWRLGAWPVLVAAALAVAAWLVVVERPALQVQRSAAPQPQAGRSAGAVAGEDDAQRWQAFRAALPPRDGSAEAVQRLIALTGQDLAWRQAEFVHSDDAPLGLTRLQIAVPVNGSYPALRQALVRALQDMPALAVDQVLFQRQTGGDTELQARVRFSLWMTREPSAAASAPGRSTER